MELGRRLGSTNWEHDQLFSATELSMDLADFADVEHNIPALKGMQENLPHKTMAQIATRTLEARLLRFRGEWEEAVPALHACLEENKQHGFAWMAAGLVSTLSDLLLEMERVEDAEQVLNSFVMDHPEISPVDRIFSVMMLGAVRIRQGRIDEARKLLEDGHHMVEKYSTSSGKALVFYTQARLQVAQGEWQAAFETFDQLASILQGNGARWYQARIYREWADAHASRAEAGDAEQAVALYHRAIQIYKDLKLPRYIDRVGDKLKTVLPPDEARRPAS